MAPDGATNRKIAKRGGEGKKTGYDLTVLPAVRVGVSSGDGSGSRKLGEVDPATGLFSGDIGEKPALRVLLVVAADSDEPLAVRSVRVDP